MKHGRPAYASGCRCEECREGHRTYMLEYQRMARRRKGVPLQGSRGDKKKARRFKARAQRVARIAAAGSSGSGVFIVAPDGAVLGIQVPASRRKSRLREAHECGDSSGIINELLAHTSPVGECLVWQRGVDGRGYGKVAIGGKLHAPHRLMAEALYGPLHGEPVHHKCANTKCIAPAHLQRVSQRENIAEMLERQWYIQRIAELEAALAHADLGRGALSHPSLADA